MAMLSLPKFKLVVNEDVVYRIQYRVGITWYDYARLYEASEEVLVVGPAHGLQDPG